MKAAIIDDEPDCVSALEKLLKKWRPSVEVVVATTNPLEGAELARKCRPDLIFLDIEMPVMNGFQLLDKIGVDGWHIIFTTAYDQYAVKAIKYSALDYLLKPIDATDLITALDKVHEKRAVDSQQIEILRKQLQTPHFLSDKIALPNAHGYNFIDINQIIMCESDESYTKVYLLDKQVPLITKQLGEVEEIMDGQSFFRVHRKYLVNLKHIVRFINTEGAQLIMKNDLLVPIARNRRTEFTQLFLKF